MCTLILNSDKQLLFDISDYGFILNGIVCLVYGFVVDTTSPYL